MSTAWPTATLVHLPVHASWLNQVEIYFSVLQRKAISPVDFADLDALAERILAFQDRYNGSDTVRLDLRPPRPPRPARPDRPARRDHAHDRRMTPDELTNSTTSLRSGGTKARRPVSHRVVAADQPLHRRAAAATRVLRVHGQRQRPQRRLAVRHQPCAWSRPSAFRGRIGTEPLISAYQEMVVIWAGHGPRQPHPCCSGAPLSRSPHLRYIRGC